jgi:tetratricopeptide (TPR) repeat protein
MAKTPKNNPSKIDAANQATLKGNIPSWLLPNPRHAIGIFFLGVLLYANTFRHEYALDDAIVITENMFTQEGISGIPGLLQYDTFYGFFKDPSKKRLVAGGRYRPFTPVMFAVEKSVFGENQRIAAHVINALLYGFTGVVLYWIVVALFREGKERIFVALGLALIFTTHPIHTEAVANIKGRDEIVALLASLLALWFGWKAYKQNMALWHLPAALSFFIALLSKENAITFLAVVPITFYYFSKAGWRQIAGHTLPFLAVAIIFLIIRGGIVGWNLGDPPRELMNNPFLKLENNQWVEFSVAEKTATISTTLWEYFRLMVFPHPLTHDYYPRHIKIGSWGDPKALLGLAVNLALIGIALRGLLKKDPASYGIWIYLITLSIASNIVFPVGTNMSERFLYMPSVGLALAASVWIYRQFKGRNGVSLKWGMALIAVAATLFSIKTVTRNGVWRDNFTLFTTDVKTAPNSAKLRNAAGGELITQSVKPENKDRKTSMLKEAEQHLREAIRIHPTYKNAHLLLGNCLNYLEEYESSIQSYQNALAIDPTWKDAIDNLGITYRDAGKFFGEKRGDIQKALTYLKEADRIRPNEFETLRLLGVANGVSGNLPAAQEYFSKAIAVNDKHPDTWFDLGLTYLNLGDANRYQECMTKARALEPEIELRRRVK